mgnify:FL=1
MLEDCFLFFSDNKETDVSLQILLSIVPAIFGIIGVVLGGCITYSIQKKERIKQLKKDAYVKILEYLYTFLANDYHIKAFVNADADAQKRLSNIRDDLCKAVSLTKLVASNKIIKKAEELLLSVNSYEPSMVRKQIDDISELMKKEIL